jgi:dipeptidyl aminopeptidase/acylaminoacyl peptidase
MPNIEKHKEKHYLLAEIISKFKEKLMNMQNHHLPTLCYCLLIAYTLFIVPKLYSQTGPLDGRGGGIIAFTSDRDGSTEIYLMNADGTEQTRVTMNNAFEFGLSWSQDGNRLAFCSNLPGDFEIYIMDVIDITTASFTSPVRITNNSVMEMSPTWSPDGLRLAFDSGISGIAIMNSDGSNISYLNTSPVQGANQPAWSPVGDRIAFSSGQGIYTVSSEGTDLYRLTTSYSLVPAWSPDASKLAYVTGTTDEDIYTINQDGTENKRITSSSENDFVPCWSPDGARIVYEGSISGNDEICIIDLDGENLTRLTNKGINRGPVWRPVLGDTSINSVNFPFQTSNESLLYQNYPNPFVHETTITFFLSQDAKTELRIYSLSGQEIRTLVNSNYFAGYHSVKWDGRNDFHQLMNSGVYVYAIKVGDRLLSKRMMSIK